jgi:hypothetical protein
MPKEESSFELHPSSTMSSVAHIDDHVDEMDDHDVAIVEKKKVRA